MPIARRPANKKGAARRPVLAIRDFAIGAQLWIYRSWFGMTIGQGVKLSLRAKLDLTNPRGIHIGDRTYIAFGAVVFTHDMVRLLHTDTYIGSECFIGANAIVMARCESATIASWAVALWSPRTSPPAASSAAIPRASCVKASEPGSGGY